MLASFPKVLKTQRPKALKIDVLDYPTVVWRPLRGTPGNIRTNLILPESRVIGLHLRCWQCGSIFIQIFAVGSERRMTFETVYYGPSRPSQVVDFGTNQKRVCDFLYCPVFEISQVFCWEQRLHPYSTRILGCSPWTRLPMLWLPGAKT